MEAKTNAASDGPMEAKDWPDWVLTFHGGFFPLDPIEQAEQHAKFKTWQVDRAIWFEAQGITFSSRECESELRRRAAVHQKLHPQDRGPATTLNKRNHR